MLAAGFIWYQQSQITELKSGVFERDRIFDHDKECAAQAEKLFVSLGWHASGDVVNGFIAGYSNHFSPKFKKCFMRLNTTGIQQPSQNYVVMDAFEQREYAEYYGLFVDALKTYRVSQCEVSVPELPKRTCSSVFEWEQLITPLMTD